MGEIAESIVAGEVCMECGVHLYDGLGVPHLCAACDRESHKARQIRQSLGYTEVFQCDRCKPQIRTFLTEQAVVQHIRDRHR